MGCPRLLSRIVREIINVVLQEFILFLINRTKEDEKYRHDHETEFVNNFKKHIKTLILNYLATKHGQEEIRCVALELDRINKTLEAEQAESQKNDKNKEKGKTKYDNKPQLASGILSASGYQIEEKEAIRKIFGRFDSDNSNSIDRYK